MTAVRVELPSSLSTLAGVGREVLVCVETSVTQRALLDALEAHLPVLRGTIRDQSTKQRRQFVRFFACGQDFSHASPDDPLPERVADGSDVFMVVGAIAGG